MASIQGESSIFNSLPAEILQRVASFSNAETALSLMLCNKKLNSAVWDPFIFRDIISNSNGHSHSLDQAWDVSFLPTSTPTSVLVRYAVADSKARSWRYLPRLGHHDPSFTCTDTHSVWAPHLAALGHPFLKELDLQTYLSCTSIISGHQRRKLKYVVNGALLSRDSREFVEDPRMSSWLTPLVNGQVTAPEHLNLILSLAIWQTQTQLARQSELTFPPSYPKIPLHRMVSAPIAPFTSDDNLDACYIKSLTSKEFIEDGEWQGFYSFDIQLTNYPRFDPPMKGIKFTVGSVTSFTDAVNELVVMTPYMSTLHVSANGTDHVGDFRLGGQIYADGRVNLVKDYDQGPTWNWDVKMTPWGMIGFWGGEQGDRYGYVWLWKKHWSA